MNTESDPIERSETGVRALYSLLFFVIWRVLGLVIAVVVLFQIIFTLITRQLPPMRVRRFANRAISYIYRVGRYVTYNDPERPFPFADLPGEIEPSGDVRV